jgi:hypothetical protein
VCPRGSSCHLPVQGSSGAATCPLGSSCHLPAQGNSGGAACPRGSGPDENRRAEQLRKQIEPSAVFDPITTGTMMTKEPTRLSNETAAACLRASGGSLPAVGRRLSRAAAGRRAATQLE